MTIPMTLRSKKYESTYQRTIKQNKTRTITSIETIKDFVYWKIVPNDFPYDMVYETSHMLVLKRRASDMSRLDPSELNELIEIKECYINDKYDQIIENLSTKRSVKNIYHLHLVRLYKDRKDIKL